MESPSALLIRLPKSFGINEARLLAAELDPRLLRDQPSVIFDLSHVKQIDTAGLDMLLGCMVRIAKQDGTVQLGGISPEAATILELARMDTIFDMFPRIPEDTSTFRVLPEQPVVQEQGVEEVAPAEEPQPLAA